MWHKMNETTTQQKYNYVSRVFKRCTMYVCAFITPDKEKV